MHPWLLDCPQCEDFLRHDPLWSPTISEIPETHDETIRREDLEKRGARNQQQMTALALAKLAGIPGAADALGMAMGSDGASVTTCLAGHPNPSSAKFCTECGARITAPGPVRCPDGHESPAGARFCVECGKPAATPAEPGAALQAALDRAAAAEPEKVIVLPPAVKAAEAPAAPVAEPEPDAPDLASLHPATLKKMCRDAGLKDTGTKGDLIKRLQKAQTAAV